MKILVQEYIMIQYFFKVRLTAQNVYLDEINLNVFIGFALSKQK